jgi:acetyl esterase/lipase
MPDHPPIDPEVAAALAALDLPSPSLRAADIVERRAAAVLDMDWLRRGGTVTIADRQIPGPTGNPEITVAVLAPTAGPAGPGLLYIHGGGMVLGTRWDIDESLLRAVEDGWVVVTVEYRLAPENPYPAAIEDCYAAWEWTASHATDLGIDPARLGVAGASAGGGLAAGMTLLARDRGGPMPCHQLLLCPMLDDRAITASSQELDGVGRWDRTANHTGWTAYLGREPGGDDVPAYAAPARAAELSGLPPTYLEVGAVDTFRDENIDYAARLSRAGVPVELHVWPGAVHGFTALAPDAAVSRAAVAVRRDCLTRLARIAEPAAAPA